MPTRLCPVLALVLLAVTAPRADSDLIALWNFNDGINSDLSAANAANLFAVDRGSGSMTTTFTFGGVTGITAFTGTTINAQGGDPAGQALALQGGASLANNSKALTFSASTLGFQDITVSFATQKTATGFNSDQFQFSLDGSTFTPFGAPYVPPDSFGLVSFDLSGIAGLNNNPTATFRIVFSGATNASGNNRIDNLLIAGTALPEPSTLVVLALGTVALLVTLRWRRRASPDRATA